MSGPWCFPLCNGVSSGDSISLRGTPRSDPRWLWTLQAWPPCGYFCEWEAGTEPVSLQSPTLLRAPHPTCPGSPGPALTQAVCTAARHSARPHHSSGSRRTRRSSQTSHRPRPRAGSPWERTPHSDTTTETDRGRASPLQAPHPSENKVGGRPGKAQRGRT